MNDEYSRVSILGFPITSCRTGDVRDIMKRTIEQSPSQGGGICRFATVNLNFLRLADEDPAIRNAIMKCDHLLADGWPVLELARAAGQPLPERITGSSLVPLIMEWARQEGWRVALVGGRKESCKAIREKGAYEDVISGHWLRTYKSNADEDLIDTGLCAEIRESGADIVLAALGCPRQEFWLHLNLEASGACAGIGIGCSLEYLANVRSRAPEIIQKLHLEFAWRLAQEPNRLGQRYFRDYLYWRRIRREWAGELEKGATHHD